MNNLNKLRGLTSTAKLIFQRLSRDCRKDAGGQYNVFYDKSPGKVLANQLGISERSAYYALNQLTKNGLIVRVYNAGMRKTNQNVVIQP